MRAVEGSVCALPASTFASVLLATHETSASGRWDIPFCSRRLAGLEGVDEEHVTALRRASTTQPGSRYPLNDDPLAQAAYTAAALRGLAEAVAALHGSQATAGEPTKARKAS